MSDYTIDIITSHMLAIDTIRINNFFFEQEHHNNNLMPMRYTDYNVQRWIQIPGRGYTFLNI